MRTRQYSAWIALAAACGLLATAVPVAAQQYKLTFADQNPATGWGPMNAVQPWAKKVEAATKGQVAIEIYPSQTLVKGPDIWKAVRAGTVDMGWCVHTYWPEMTPLADVMSLPGLPMKSAEQGSGVLWRLYEKFPGMRKEFSDVEPLLLHTTSVYFLLTSKKQVKTLEDLKGLKIRVVGAPAAEQIKALGGIPTPMPMPDVYQSMDKRVVDGAGLPWEAILSFRLYEVGKYYTMVPLSAGYFSLCTNKEKWQSLPQTVRDQIMSVSGFEGSRFFGRNFFDTAEQGVLEKVKTGNYEMERYAPPPDELARWTRVGSEPVWDDWVKKMEGKGFKESREVLNTTLDLLKQ